MLPQSTYAPPHFRPRKSLENTAVLRPLSTGKEKDSETGYYYFGARYYNPDLSLWLSVDPMSDKYPSLSPYNYCALNPVKIVDNDGNEPIIPYVGNVNGFVKFMNGLQTGIGTSTGNMAHAAMLRMGMTKGFKPANTAPFNTSGGNRYIYGEGRLDRYGTFYVLCR